MAGLLQTCYDAEMAFARWDPLRDLLAWQDRIERLSTGESAGWAPPVDLFETAGAYVVTAELPGLAREHISIHFENGQLTLRGARPAPATKCEQYHRVERGHGRFTRSFALPLAASAEAITADLRDGVLTITVTKAADRGLRRITIA